MYLCRWVLLLYWLLGTSFLKIGLSETERAGSRYRQRGGLHLSFPRKGRWYCSRGMVAEPKGSTPRSPPRAIAKRTQVQKTEKR
jgi:hypothetical protein